jgi:hypothetical protein
MVRENYRIKTACPQCGCTELTVLSAREIKEKYGDLPNFDMECGECMEKYSAAGCRNNGNIKNSPQSTPSSTLSSDRRERTEIIL